MGSTAVGQRVCQSRRCTRFYPTAGLDVDATDGCPLKVEPPLFRGVNARPSRQTGSSDGGGVLCPLLRIARCGPRDPEAAVGLVPDGGQAEERRRDASLSTQARKRLAVLRRGAAPSFHRINFEIAIYTVNSFKSMTYVRLAVREGCLAGRWNREGYRTIWLYGISLASRSSCRMRRRLAGHALPAEFQLHRLPSSTESPSKKAERPGQRARCRPSQAVAALPGPSERLTASEIGLHGRPARVCNRIAHERFRCLCVHVRVQGSFA